jgi:hypothetical protein
LSLDPPRLSWEQPWPDYEKGSLSRENGGCEASHDLDQEGTFSMSSSHSPGGLVVSFGDDHAVAIAGRLLPATLTERLGIETVIDELVDLGARPDVGPDLAEEFLDCVDQANHAFSQLTEGSGRRCW